MRSIRDPTTGPSTTPGTEMLRGDEDLQQIPLVVYTAVDLGAAERERLQLGRTRIMTKGRSTPADVEEHVTQLLESLSQEAVS